VYQRLVEKRFRFFRRLVLPDQIEHFAAQLFILRASVSDKPNSGDWVTRVGE